MLDLSRNVDYTDYIYHNFGYYEDEEAIKEEDPDDPILVEFPTSVTLYSRTTKSLDQLPPVAFRSR